MNRLSDEQLISLCAQGRRDAMDMLVSRHHSRLLDFVFRHIHDRDSSADIVQSTFVKVFQNARSYRSKASLKTWMYTIALNLVKDEYRRGAARPKEVSADAVEADGIESEDLAAVSPETSAINTLMGDALWEAVDDLPENPRTAVILKFRQGLTYEEIADVMHAPSGTVKSWVHHSLRALRRSFEPSVCED